MALKFTDEEIQEVFDMFREWKQENEQYLFDFSQEYKHLEEALVRVFGVSSPIVDVAYFAAGNGLKVELISGHGVDPHLIIRNP